MTPQERKVMKLALEALESCDKGDWSTGYVIHASYDEKAVADAITALRQALEQSTKQEPTEVHQFRSPCCSDWYDGVPDHSDGNGLYDVRTLYTQPQEAAPSNEMEATERQVEILTDELANAQRWIEQLEQSTEQEAAQRQPLTDEEVEKIIKQNMSLQMNLAGIRADFEAAHGIKENT